MKFLITNDSNKLSRIYRKTDFFETNYLYFGGEGHIGHLSAVNPERKHESYHLDNKDMFWNNQRDCSVRNPVLDCKEMIDCMVKNCEMRLANGYPI